MQPLSWNIESTVTGLYASLYPDEKLPKDKGDMPGLIPIPRVDPTFLFNYRRSVYLLGPARVDIMQCYRHWNHSLQEKLVYFFVLVSFQEFLARVNKPLPGWLLLGQNLAAKELIIHAMEWAKKIVNIK